MANELLIDNDVVKKLAIYGLFEGLAASARPADWRLIVLGAAPYVLSKAIEKSKTIRARNEALGRLKEALALCEVVEPRDEEIELAASLEDAAQRLGLPFDQGESLLIAALTYRVSAALITGDKRALAGAATLLTDHAELSTCSGRIACLEQVILAIIADGNGAAEAGQICQEPDVDRALSICFRCASSFDPAAAREGLASYVESVRRASGPFLCAGLDLSGLFEKDRVGLS